MDVKVTVECAVNPTEDEDKVERALHKIFPSAPIERIVKTDDKLLFRINGSGAEFVTTFRSLLKQERIRAAARSILLSGTIGHRIRIYLNKQAAFVGHVSFCESEGESPHGPISVEIESPDPESIIDFLTSRPEQGFGREFRERRRR